MRGNTRKCVENLNYRPPPEIHRHIDDQSLEMWIVYRGHKLLAASIW
jgi:hypothetical protein